MQVAGTTHPHADSHFRSVHPSLPCCAYELHCYVGASIAWEQPRAVTHKCSRTEPHTGHHHTVASTGMGAHSRHPPATGWHTATHSATHSSLPCLHGALVTCHSQNQGCDQGPQRPHPRGSCCSHGQCAWRGQRVESGEATEILGTPTPLAPLPGFPPHTEPGRCPHHQRPVVPRDCRVQGGGSPGPSSPSRARREDERGTRGSARDQSQTRRHLSGSVSLPWPHLRSSPT